MANDQAVALERAWSLCLGFIPAFVAKAVCELGVPDILAAAAQQAEAALDGRHPAGAGGLSALQIVERLQMKVEWPPHEAAEQLDRLMRCLCAYDVFKASLPNEHHVRCNEDHLMNAATESAHHVTAAPPLQYELTPVSRCLTGSASLQNFLLLKTNSTMLLPWQCLSQYVVKGTQPFNAAHSMDLWELSATQPAVNKLFNAGMSSASDVALGAFLEHYPGLSNVSTLVDVGGGIGTSASRIVARHPSIKAINFDLPHVVAEAPTHPGVAHIPGDMFQGVPKGDAIFMKWILHDWDDERCINILNNCHKALPKDGKIIVMDAVLQDATSTINEHSFNNVRRVYDMVMIAHTNGGKERTRKEWEYILSAAKFRLNKVYDLPCPQCVLEAFPC